MECNVREVGVCLRRQRDYVRVRATILRKEEKGEQSLMYSTTEAQRGETAKGEYDSKALHRNVMLF